MTTSAPILVISDDIAAEFSHSALTIMRFGEWRDKIGALGDRPVIHDMIVLGLCLSPAAEAAFQADAALVDLVEAAQVPHKTLPLDANREALLATALEFLADRDATTRQQGAADRAALAELRRGHMQMQTDHAELESWVWDAMAPKFTRVREWPATAGILKLPGPETPLTQPLPVPARGFIAVDVHLAASAPSAGTIHFVLAPPCGPDFEHTAASHNIRAGESGWTRLILPRAPGGFPQDAVLKLWWQGADAPQLSLAPDSPFADVNVSAGGTPQSAPLALNVYQTLPRQPGPPLHDPRRALPADGHTRLVLPGDLAPPQALPYSRNPVRKALKRYPDFTRVEFWEKENAVFVHPSIHRPVVALVPGLTVDALVQIEAIIRVFRDKTLPISFAIGAAPSGTVASSEEALTHLGDWMQLLPAEWGEAWCGLATPLSGSIDLLLATAMPNMPVNRDADALFCGFRLTTQADGAQG